jgi:hypothetical protein
MLTLNCMEIAAGRGTARGTVGDVQGVALGDYPGPPQWFEH